MSVFTDPPPLPPGLPDGCVVVTARLSGARGFPPDVLTHATRHAYADLFAAARRSGRSHLLRIWNYVPALLSPTGDGTNRYMAFNAGRYAAMHDAYGDDLATLAPAGTGVGHAGDELIVHAIAAAEPGVNVQNPRQTPAVNYSARYGPRPPCFARATKVGRVLLVSGTAAIAGEDTVAPNELPAQLDLTLEHLGALAGGLEMYRSLRAYVPRAGDAAAVADRLAAAYPRVGRVTPVVADLCRPELRVEIEGVAVESDTP